DEVCMDSVEPQAQMVEALAQNTIRGFRLLERIGPAVHQRADRFEARGVADRHLVELRRRPAFYAGEVHTIAGTLLELNGCEVGNAIGRDVVARIADLVKKLFGDTCDRDTAAGAGMLGDNERAVALDFKNRV